MYERSYGHHPDRLTRREVLSSTHLQELRVVSTQLLQQGGKEGGVLLDDLSHLLELRLVPQELQRVF